MDDDSEFMSSSDFTGSAGDSSSSNSTGQLSDDVKEITRLWINEKAVPELLPYAKQTVDNLERSIADRVRQLEVAGSEIVKLGQQYLFYEFEADRIRHLIVGYKRVRLFKIQKWFLHLTSSPSAQASLSTAEKMFLRDYAEIRTKQLEASTLNHLPDTEKHLGLSSSSAAGAGAGAGSDDVDLGYDAAAAADSSPEARVRSGPNHEKYIAAYANSDVSFDVGTNSVDLKQGDLLIVQYNHVRRYIRGGQVSAR